MHLPEQLQPYLDLLRKHQAKLYPIAAGALFLLGTTLILLGIFFSKQHSVQAKAVESFSKSQKKSVSTPSETSDEKIMVDIGGAVTKPGLYTLQKGDRLSRAVELAGGFDSKVNKSYVAHSLNLSMKVADEEKIYIPYQKENIDAVIAKSKSGVAVSNTNDSVVNLNSSSQLELESLTGVGAVRAEKIISGRPFKTLQELVQKGILTQKILNDNKEKIKI